MNRSIISSLRNLILVAVGIGILGLALTACGGRAGKPPVEVTFRDSMIGAGKVVLIRNTTDQALAEIRVQITGPQGDEHAYQQSTLGGHQSFEIGWKKLGGWEIPPGSKVEVRCSGYLLPHRAELPPGQ